MIPAEYYCPTCGAANAGKDGACFACGASLKITAPLAPTGALLQGNGNAPLLKQRYRILQQVGNGGFSVVYKAEDTHDNNRKVAIKAITLNGLKPQEMIEATEAFNREMLILSNLKHRNLPGIHHHFSDTTCWYLVMDFIEGITLETHLEKMPGNRLPVEETLDIALLLCDVLEYLHERQPPVIFRDIKPANVMLTSEGHLALIDFGIARRFKPGQQKDTMVFGSPGYAAPEQYGKAQTTPRSDIYSLGVLLHQLLTGDDPSLHPFKFAPIEAKSDTTLLRLNALITRMVALDAQNRPESSIIVKNELQGIADDYALQRIKGLQAANAPLYIPPKVSWQTSGLSRSPIGAIPLPSAQAQVAMMQQQAYGPYWPGSSSTSGSAYTGTAAGGTAQKATRSYNDFALASLLFSLLGFVMPLLLCTMGGQVFQLIQFDSAQNGLFIGFLVLMGPPLIAVICGHIGLHRANTLPQWQSGRSMAMTGLTIGYIFCSIYGLFLCMIAGTLMHLN